MRNPRDLVRSCNHPAVITGSRFYRSKPRIGSRSLRATGVPVLRYQGSLDAMADSTHSQSARGLQKMGWDSVMKFDDVRPVPYRAARVWLADGTRMLACGPAKDGGASRAKLPRQDGNLRSGRRKLRSFRKPFGRKLRLAPRLKPETIAAASAASH